MLSALRFVQTYYIRHNFKVDTFTTEDYKTMSHLLKERFLIHNQDIKVFKDIKLLDQNNKLIGVYPASQARKKASSLKKDITLVNSTSDPVICRVVQFRNNLLNKFFDEIVYKHNEKLLSRANSTKQLKIALNLNQNQLKVKAKQIIELSKKNIKVRIFMNCKQQTKNECLQKLQLLKSQIQGKCIIDRDIKNDQPSQKASDQQPQKKPSTQTFSFSCKSRQNEFMQMLKQSSQKAPDESIMNFLKKYYKQQDVDMLDLKVTGQSISEGIDESHNVDLTKKEKNVLRTDSRTKGKGVYKQDEIDKDNFMEKEAKARILNDRLKAILGWTA